MITVLDPCGVLRYTDIFTAFPAVCARRLVTTGLAKDVGKMAGELKDVPAEFQVHLDFLFSVLRICY